MSYNTLVSALFYKASTSLGDLLFCRGADRNSVEVLCEIPLASEVTQIAKPSDIYSDETLANNLSLESAITEARNVLFDMSILSAQDATNIPFNI